MHIQLLSSDNFVTGTGSSGEHYHRQEWLRTSASVSWRLRFTRRQCIKYCRLARENRLHLCHRQSHCCTCLHHLRRKGRGGPPLQRWHDPSARPGVGPLGRYGQTKHSWGHPHLPHSDASAMAGCQSRTPAAVHAVTPRCLLSGCECGAVPGSLQQCMQHL